MHKIALGFIVLTTFLTIGIAVLYLRKGTCSKGRSLEGFASAKLSAKERIEKASSSASNILIDVIQQAKRVSTYVTNPVAWKERIALATMSPMELARKHLSETNKPKV
jgi:hypothetical protein